MNCRPSSDTALLERLEHDAVAFELFYRRHVSAVTRFAASRCRCAADVADVVAGTFEAVMSAASRFDPRRGSARGWLLGIAAHEASIISRRSSNDRKAVGRIQGWQLLDDDDIERLEARMDAQRMAPALSLALNRASPGEREMFLLVAQDDLTPSEAARVLGISAGAARVRLSRVRERLRRSLPAEVGI